MKLQFLSFCLNAACWLIDTWDKSRSFRGKFPSGVPGERKQRSWPDHEDLACDGFFSAIFIFYLEYIRSRMGRAGCLQAVRGNEKAGAECQLSSPYSPLDVLANTLSWDTTWHSGRCQRLLKEKDLGGFTSHSLESFYFGFFSVCKLSRIFFGGREGVSNICVSLSMIGYSARSWLNIQLEEEIREEFERWIVASVTFSASQLQ